METYRFKDALTNSWVDIDYPSLVARPVLDDELEANGNVVAVVDVSPAGDEGTPGQVKGLFYPGCSVINHALPLIPLLNDMLAEAGVVNGMSVLCCGRILDFEKGTEERHASFNNAFTDACAELGVERIVTACPNCAETLAKVLAADERTAHVKVLALSSELARLGYRLDPEVIERVVATKKKMLDDEKMQSRLISDAIDEIYARAAGDETPTDASAMNAVDAVTAEALATDAGVLETVEEVAEALEAVDATMPDVVEDGEVPLWVHRSCPDLQTLMFARGVIELAPEGWVINEDLKPTGCCGSKAQAVGRFDVAERQAQHIASRAADEGARAIVAACMSCTTALASSQLDVPIIHYLELLFDWPIDWRAMQPGVAFRFLIEDDSEPSGAGRQFIGLPKMPKREVA